MKNNKKMIKIKRKQFGELEGISIQWGNKFTSLPIHKEKVVGGSIDFSGMTLPELQEFGKQLANLKCCVS